MPDTTTAPRGRLRAEGLITLGDAARMAGVSRSAVLRWLISGRQGRKLEAMRVRGEWHTSRAALERFSRSQSLETHHSRHASRCEI